jgi:hypothetical protein
MKEIAVLFSCMGLLSCTNDDVAGKNIDKVDCKGIHCLDVSYNLDSVQISKKIAQKKTLLIFTAWTMPHTTVLDSSLLGNASIYDAVSKYSVIVQYVDDKGHRHPNDANRIGDINLQYEISNFDMAMQPLYIIYINGLPRSMSTYLGKEEKDILHFLNGSDSTSPVIDSKK